MVQTRPVIAQTVTYVYDNYYIRRCTCTYVTMYVRICVHPVVTFIAPPENITVCRGSNVTISCGFQSGSILPTTWLINGTMYTQEELRDNPLYQLNKPARPTSYSLTVFSINSSTTFQCIVHSTPTTTSTLGTVTVKGTYVRLYQYVRAHTVHTCTCIYTNALVCTCVYSYVAS